jgi:hypothetical protein
MVPRSKQKYSNRQIIIALFNAIPFAMSKATSINQFFADRNVQNAIEATREGDTRSQAML